MSSFLSTLVVLVVALSFVEGKKVTELSFERPFETIGKDGTRQCSPDWYHGGSTVVHKSFARLTVDRQNKRGWIWNRSKMNLDEFSLILTFRISGQGKTWFGDGIGLWLTQSPAFRQGDNHGFIDKYIGVGIVFDTFRNTEHKGGHKDVSVTVNDGTLSLDEQTQNEKQGCDVPGIRYSELNAAFSASVNASRVKIQYKNNFLKVAMDPKNTGEWTNCYESKVALPVGWTKDATIGLTATTGALADNHDLLGLVVYDTVEDMDHKQSDLLIQDDKEKMGRQIDDYKEDKDRIDHLQKQLKKLQEDFEHQLEAIKEKTENTISKLRKQEEEDDRRIIELENFVDGMVNNKMKQSIHSFSKNVDDKLKKTVDESVANVSGWKTPFFILILAFGGITFIAYRKYTDLRKSHLL